MNRNSECPAWKVVITGIKKMSVLVSDGTFNHGPPVSQLPKAIFPYSAFLLVFSDFQQQNPSQAPSHRLPLQGQWQQCREASPEQGPQLLCQNSTCDVPGCDVPGCDVPGPMRLCTWCQSLSLAFLAVKSWRIKKKQKQKEKRGKKELLYRNLRKNS